MAGRLSRRELLRRGALVGISAPVLGGILAACGSSSPSSSGSSGGTSGGKAGATINVGIITPAAAINPLTVADQGGLDMLGQTGEYLTFSDQHLTLQPQLATKWSSNSDRGRVDVHDPPGASSSTTGRRSRPTTSSTPTSCRPTRRASANALSAFGGVLTPDGVTKTGPYEGGSSGASRRRTGTSRT